MQGTERERLPNSKVSKATIVIIENIKRQQSISFAKALELCLLESVTFNNNLDGLKKKNSDWFKQEVEVLKKQVPIDKKSF